MKQSVITLVSVCVGVLLSRGWEVWREHRKKCQGKRSLRGELKLNLAMVPPKKDILLNAKRGVAQGLLAPMNSVHFSSVFHDLHLGTIYSGFSDLEAQSLHFIREHIRIIDAAMDSLLDDLKADLKSKEPAEVGQFYAGLVGDLLSAMERLEDMLRKHLSGKPVAVIERTNEYLATKKI